jgi:hypothetical protein
VEVEERQIIVFSGKTVTESFTRLISLASRSGNSVARNER